MKTIDQINNLALFFLAVALSSPVFAMDPSVANEVCKQYAEEENVPKEEQYNYIRDCVNNIESEEIEKKNEETKNQAD